MAQTEDVRIQRLGPQDRELARTTFALMAAVFAEQHAPLSDRYLDRLLARSDFWALSARYGDTVVGGLTAHTLMMTTHEGVELFLYDIAVAPQHQRRGIGRQLVETLRAEASSVGISTIFVLADDEDTEALAFYSALGGAPSEVTLFEFGSS